MPLMRGYRQYTSRGRVGTEWHTIDCHQWSALFILMYILMYDIKMNLKWVERCSDANKKCAIHWPLIALGNWVTERHARPERHHRLCSANFGSILAALWLERSLLVRIYVQLTIKRHNRHVSTHLDERILIVWDQRCASRRVRCSAGLCWALLCSVVLSQRRVRPFPRSGQFHSFKALIISSKSMNYMNASDDCQRCQCSGRLFANHFHSLRS